MAPEVYEYYSQGTIPISSIDFKKADVYGLGASFHTYLFDWYPTENKLVKRIIEPSWMSTNSACRHMIEGMLEWDPKARLTTAQVLNHKCLTQYRGKKVVAELEKGKGMTRVKRTSWREPNVPLMKWVNEDRLKTVTGLGAHEKSSGKKTFLSEGGNSAMTRRKDIFPKRVGGTLTPKADTMLPTTEVM